MTQFSDEAIERILTAAAQRHGGAVSIVDLISLSSLYNNVYGQPHCSSRASPAAVDGLEDQEAPPVIEEEDAQGGMYKVAPATSQWTAAASLVWSVAVMVWAKVAMALTGFVAVLSRVQACLLTAFDDSFVADAEDEQDPRSGDDEAAAAELLHFLVNLLHAKASERDAHDSIVNAHAQHAAAHAGFESVLSEWPVVSVDQGTSSRVLSLYADVSVAVDALLTTRDANRGESIPSDDDCGRWV